MTRLQVAIVGLYPDAGHIVPLLRIGRLLVARGHDVLCLLPDECSRLARTFGLANKPIGSALSPIAVDASRRFVARTIFTASCDVYYCDYYAAIFARAAGMVGAILRELESPRPDMVLADNHQFPEIFAGIGAEMEVPVLFHDSTGGTHSRAGSLAANLYGRQLPRWKEAGIAALAVGYYVARDVARKRRFRRHRLPQETAKARKDLSTLLTKLPPSKRTHVAPSSAGAVSAASSRMKYHFATGIGLLEHRRRGCPLLPDRHIFGPVLDFPEIPLPATLKEWLDGRPQHSVVYVSFGSMVRLSSRRLRMLLSTFAALDVPVLWASGCDTGTLSMLALPSTVRLEPAVPQCSVLRHPAVGACVTHGGSGTVLECLTSAVPLLVMPMMWDQPYNAQLVQDLGAGVRVDWWLLRQRVLMRKLRSVLQSPEYRRTAASIATELREQRGSEAVLRFLETVATSGDRTSWSHGP